MIVSMQNCTVLHYILKWDKIILVTPNILALFGI